ncbi:MAG: phosphotransferase [Nocardioidaceae bacterium]
MTPALVGLSEKQQALVDTWLPGATVVQSHGWGLVQTSVFELRYAGERLIVKAGGASDGHIAREIHAHHSWLEPWTRAGRAPILEFADEEAKILVTRYLPGDLVLGTTSADEPSTYHQAGELLAQLHAEASVTDAGYEEHENEKALTWLNEPHRIAPATVERLRAEIATWPAPPASLVPTHGDWQPRNWLVHDGLVRIIDFGRAAMRPPMTDLARLAVQDFLRKPELETAFLAGYGSDPRAADAWQRTRVREAIGTATWAHRVGDDRFEAQGHRMIAAALPQV